MRTSYTPPSVRAYEQLFLAPSLRGRGLGDIKLYTPDHYTLRGGGILSFLAGLARRAVPFLMQTLAPEGLQLAQNVLNDVNTGSNTRQAIKTRGLESIKNITRKLAGGSRRKLKRLKRKKKKKTYFKDIFSFSN